jgi:hypothetical protein
MLIALTARTNRLTLAALPGGIGTPILVYQPGVALHLCQTQSTRQTNVVSHVLGLVIRAAGAILLVWEARLETAVRFAAVGHIALCSDCRMDPLC